MTKEKAEQKRRRSESKASESRNYTRELGELLIENSPDALISSPDQKRWRGSVNMFERKEKEMRALRTLCT